MKGNNIKTVAVNRNQLQKMCYRNGWKTLKKSSSFIPHLIIYICLSNWMVQSLLANEYNSLDESLFSIQQNNTLDQNYTSHRQGRCKSDHKDSFNHRITIECIQCGAFTRAFVINQRNCVPWIVLLHFLIITHTKIQLTTPFVLDSFCGFELR